MTLHYTPNLRTEDASVMMIGQNYIEIPPGQESVEVVGECTKEDTRLILKAPIYVTQALNHMHYMGTMVFMRSFNVSKAHVAMDLKLNFFSDPVNVWSFCTAYSTRSRFTRMQFLSVNF